MTKAEIENRGMSGLPLEAAKDTLLDRIRALRIEAIIQGDMAQAQMCRRATTVDLFSDETWDEYDDRRHANDPVATPTNVTAYFVTVVHCGSPQCLGTLCEQCGIEHHVGRLTTDHAASSHGLPVVVDASGRVYGPAEIYCAEVGLSQHEPIWDLFNAGIRAGYRIKA